MMELCKTIASEEEVLSIFGNVSELLSFHTGFLGILDKHHTSFTPKIVELLFEKYFNFVALYKSYIVTSKQVYAKKDELEKKYPQLKNVIQVLNL